MNYSIIFREDMGDEYRDTHLGNYYGTSKNDAINAALSDHPHLENSSNGWFIAEPETC